MVKCSVLESVRCCENKDWNLQKNMYKKWSKTRIVISPILFNLYMVSK